MCCFCSWKLIWLGRIYIQLVHYSWWTSPSSEWDFIKADKSISWLSFFRNYFSIPVTQLRNYFANFGKRSPSKDFLGIRERYAISNLSWFKETHSASEWTSKVTACYDTAKKQAIEEFKKLRRIKALKDTLDREFCSVCAASVYFGRDIDPVDKMQLNEIILEAFSKPNIVLDSVCYVRMMSRWPIRI